MSARYGPCGASTSPPTHEPVLISNTGSFADRITSPAEWHCNDLGSARMEAVCCANPRVRAITVIRWGVTAHAPYSPDHCQGASTDIGT